MRIYLAARYSRRRELRLHVVPLLEREGYAVTSRWLEGKHTGASRGDMARYAAEDLDDLRRADVLLAFTELPGAPGRQRGGRHVELGIAIERGMPVVLCGPRENVFCHLSSVQQSAAWGEGVLRRLRRIARELS